MQNHTIIQHPRKKPQKSNPYRVEKRPPKIKHIGPQKSHPHPAYHIPGHDTASDPRVPFAAAVPHSH
jgi:hypothetical protein